MRQQKNYLHSLYKRDKPFMSDITILIPTIDRVTALAATLSSLLFQTYSHFSVIISDQSEIVDIYQFPTIQTLCRVFATHGQSVRIHKHLPKKGLAEQRQFLLEKSKSFYSLFLDDDVILEPFVLENLMKTIHHEQCGFVGNAVIGLSLLNDVRPDEQTIEFWKGKVQPEIVSPKSQPWERFKLHNAANIYHLQKKLHISPSFPKPYKIAWIGGCVLYDTKKLLSVGGFSFWKDLPIRHAGEDVLAQQKVMHKFGGCGILPSGAYHQELPTTIEDRSINAPEYLTKI